MAETTDKADMQKAIRPFVEAARGALQFGNLTDRSEFVLSVPSGAVRTRERLMVDDLRELVRHSYRHLKCGGVTTMGQTLAETYARDPHFYSGTFCCHCGSHFPVGEGGEFLWDGTNQKVGT